jgi:hypothetical protein
VPSPDSVHPSGSTADVFARVRVRLEADEAARSLWLKLEQEMDSGGVSSAMSYVGARFKELSDRVAMALPSGGQG